MQSRTTHFLCGVALTEEIALLDLSLSGVQSARKIADKIYDALEQLTRFPLSGPSMRETDLRNLGYRFIVLEKYIIIYRLIGDTIDVYHIFDRRSDYPTLSKSEVFR